MPLCNGLCITNLAIRLLVTQRAGPVAEGYATIHAAGGLRTAVAAVQGLFYLAEIIYTFVDGTIARLLSMYR